MLENYIKYANGMNAREEVLLWLNQTLAAHLKKKKHLNNTQIEHIIDYLVSSAAPKRLLKMSIEQAKNAADKWTKTQQKKGANLIDTSTDIEIIHEYANGSKIVKLLTKKAYQREGFLMAHCLGGMSPKSDIDIYSYRDKKNNPHATFEVRKEDGEITQIKGKGNGSIHPKYVMPILDFLTSIGQKPRPSEMSNLGYYHINKDIKPLVLMIEGYEKQIVNIYGEMYAY